MLHIHSTLPRRQVCARGCSHASKSRVPSFSLSPESVLSYSQSRAAEAGERRQLTPILRAGGDVPSASKVGPLPGITAASFAGYFEVDAAAHAELFFWYVE